VCKTKLACQLIGRVIVRNASSLPGSDQQDQEEGGEGLMMAEKQKKMSHSKLERERER
jgi:hypothetical protein